MLTEKPLDSEELAVSEAGLSSDEIAGILARYDIGTISSVRAYERGSSRAPKALIESDMGEFLLKRRAPGRDDPRRIKFEHTVHAELRKAGYPVAEIMASRRSRSTAISGSLGMYELFRFIRASRCRGTSAELEACGAALSDFHGILNDFEYPTVQSGGFHAVSLLDRHVEKYSSNLSRRSRRLCNQDQGLLHGSGEQCRIAGLVEMVDDGRAWRLASRECALRRSFQCQGRARFRQCPNGASYRGYRFCHTPLRTICDRVAQQRGIDLAYPAA